MADSTVSGVGAGQALGQEQFLKLLITQLQNQDPLEPVSNTDFIAQLAQFSSLQGITNLNSNFDAVLKLEQFSGGTNLIGKTVQYAQDGSGALASGKVGGVQVLDGNVLLQVGNASVSLDSVRTVAPG